MGNIFSERQCQQPLITDPTITFRYVSNDKIFLQIYRETNFSKRNKYNDYYIYYENVIDRTQLNLTIWTPTNDSIDELIAYIKMIFNSITGQQGYCREATNIMLCSNFGYPDTTFQLSDDGVIFAEFTRLLNFVTQIDVTKPKVARLIKAENADNLGGRIF